MDCSISDKFIPGGMVDQISYQVDPSTNSMHATVALNLHSHPYLLDHQINGKAVLPMAFALNMIFETACGIYPGLQLATAIDFRVLSGVTLDPGINTNLTIELSYVKEEAEILIKVSTKQPNFRPHYSCKLIARSLSDTRKTRPIDYSGGETVELAKAYSHLLFHGPLFQAVRLVEIFPSNQLIGTVKGVNPCLLRAKFTGHPWFLDPIALDACMQIAAMHANQQIGMTVLPCYFREFLMYKRLEQQTLQVFVGFHNGKLSRNELICDIRVMDEDHELVFELLGLEGTGIALNALATP